MVTSLPRASLSGRQAGLRAPTQAGRPGSRCLSTIAGPNGHADSQAASQAAPSRLAQVRDPARGLAALVTVAGGIAAAWAISIYNSAPALVEPEAGPEGPLLGDLRRRRQPDRVHPLRQHPPAGAGEGAAAGRCDEATIAIEDKNFYEHGALDYEGIARAAWKDLQAGAAVQGASTITQQLVRNLYIHNPENTIKRKLIEASLAVELEEAHDKDWILTQYLNTRPLRDGRRPDRGRGRGGFADLLRKPAKDLNLTESALIAGLPQAPSEYNPFLDPKAATERRNEVLQVMDEQGYITAEEYREAIDQRPRPRPRQQVPGDPGPVPLRPGAAATDRRVRNQHRPQRRAQGLHDDRPRPAGEGRSTRSKTTATSVTRKAARLPASPRSTPITARSSPSPRPKATPTKPSSTTPGRRTASPAPRSRPSSSRPR